MSGKSQLLTGCVTLSLVESATWEAGTAVVECGKICPRLVKTSTGPHPRPQSYGNVKPPAIAHDSLVNKLRKIIFLKSLIFCYFSARSVPLPSSRCNQCLPSEAAVEAQREAAEIRKPETGHQDCQMHE